jgi:hypothetical protein
VTDHVQATLNYLLYEGVRPQMFMSSQPGAQPESAIKSQPFAVRIHDARAQELAPTLDRNGFELRAHRSALHDFSDDALLRAQYYPETEALLMAATGADKVMIFDHTRRLDAKMSKVPGAVPPVRGVHCDQTFNSGRRRVREHLPADEAELRLQGRCAIINVWRPLVEPLESAPLALCDARSIADDDIVTADFIYPDKVGEVAMFKPSAAHKWFYYPRMRRDEVLLIKIYDSSETGIARFSAHTAFDDPTTPADAAPRQSIELRALVFWPR